MPMEKGKERRRDGFRAFRIWGSRFSAILNLFALSSLIMGQSLHIAGVLRGYPYCEIFNPPFANLNPKPYFLE